MKANTDKIAGASPATRAFLASARAAETRRREFARFMDARRRRLEFENVMQSLSIAG